MKLNKSMEMDHYLGRGIYLRSILNPMEVFFVRSFYKDANKWLNKNPDYTVIQNPEELNNIIKSIINNIEESFSDCYVEHFFNGVVEVYKNILALKYNEGLLQVIYYDNFKIKNITLSSNYKICNQSPNFDLRPSYIKEDYSMDYYPFIKDHYTISTLKKMLEVVYGKQNCR